MDAANLGQAQPPWQMWGNTQVRSVSPGTPINPTNFDVTTLLRANYGRPDSWHWLFLAKINGGGAATGPGQNAGLTVWYEVLIGGGRSMMRIPFLNTFSWQWSGGFAVPVNQAQYVGSADSTQPVFAPGLPPLVLSQLVGQDITVLANCNYVTDVPGAPPLIVEVSGQLAPKTHVRPDWMQLDVDPSKQFPGGEVGGR